MRVLFFGALAEIAGSTYREVPVVKTTGELVEVLNKLYPALLNKKFLLAVNKQIQKQNTSLNENDEIALLPPFSGG